MSMTPKISIHAPREGGDPLNLPLLYHRGISIHAPREGGDWTAMVACDIGATFQSTPPARGATTPPPIYNANTSISIHAPREGGRRHTAATGRTSRLFQSTPPARGATPENMVGWP